MTYRLGKLPATHDPRDLLLEHYARGLDVPTNDRGNLARFADWGMLGNDTVGDCVFAGADHETMLWTLEGGHPASFQAKNALADYSRVTGYDPADPSTDQGTNVRDALNYRRRTGLIDAHGHRHKLAAYVALEPGNHVHVREAAHWLDAVGIGFQVPSYAMSQFDAGRAWTVMHGDASIEGGHYVPAVGYDSRYVYVVTWGRVQKMSWGFLAKFCDEAWGLVSVELLDAQGKSPDGLDRQQLLADARAVSA